MLLGAVKKSKRIILIVALCFVALLLTGCGASLTVYDYTDGDVKYNMYELKIDGDTVKNMERTATADENGVKYTVADYFHSLFGDFGYSLVSASSSDGQYTVRYRKAVDGGELQALGTKIEFTSKYADSLFVRTYNSKSPNPFNGVRSKYDNVQPMQSTTVLERLKNGAVAYDGNGEVVVSLPALTDAFPYLKGLDPEGFPLSYVRYGSNRMKSSGTAVKSGDSTAYTFTRYFDDTDTYIEYEYKRALPTGWYLTALATGAIVYGVIMLITRTKKQKQQPTLLDRFPYNPEEYRDYDSNLPSKLY